MAARLTLWRLSRWTLANTSKNRIQCVSLGIAAGTPRQSSQLLLCVSQAVIDKQLNAVWDELLIFNLRDVDKEEFEQAQIRINVMDADTLTRNDMIGSYTVDASFIYYKKDHEQYRTWVALVNEEDVEDTGIQGYLKCSIAIVGPGDKLKVHDEEEDKKKEKQADREAGGSVSGMVVMPPAMRREVKWLVTTFWRAMYLPQMDQNITTQNGIDAFAQVEFAGIKPLRTKVKHLLGDRSHLSPVWRTELWVPVIVPTSTQTIKYSVYDYDLTGPNELVSMFYDKFSVVAAISERSESKKVDPHWVNLYGAQVGLSAAESIATGVKINAFDWKEYYNKFGDHAPFYRGRVLLQQRIATKEEGLEKNKDKQEPFKRKVKKLDRKLEPPTTHYNLQAIVIAGTELPRFASADLRNLGQLSKMSVRISCGQYEMLSKRQPNNNGVCEWYELLMDGLEMTTYPKDVNQVPDVFVHLIKGEGKGEIACSFARFKFAELFEKGFGSEPRWIQLHEDKHLDKLDEGDFPGSVLLQIGVGDDAQWTEAQSAWKESVSSMQHRTPYELRVHIFQGRHLPSADFNGLLDPYMKVNFNGLEPKTTDRQEGTRDPQLYETLIFECALPQLKYAPQVNVQVMDWDQIGKDDYMGCFFFDLTKAKITQPEMLHSGFDADGKPIPSAPPDPEWYPLMKEEPNDTEGEVLASFELIAKTTPDQKLVPPQMKHHKKDPVVPPPSRKATVEIIVMGMRDMQPYQFQGMVLPSMEFELAMGTEVVKAVTSAKKYPNPANPNFLERILMEVKLPENPVFAPAIKVIAKDTRLGGLSTPVVGVGSIDLENKCPWSPNYEPPKMSMVSDQDLNQGNTTARGADVDVATVRTSQAAGVEESKGEDEEKESKREDEDKDPEDALDGIPIDERVVIPQVRHARVPPLVQHHAQQA